MVLPHLGLVVYSPCCGLCEPHFSKLSPRATVESEPGENWQKWTLKGSWTFLNCSGPWIQVTGSKNPRGGLETPRGFLEPPRGSKNPLGALRTPLGFLEPVFLIFFWFFFYFFSFFFFFSGVLRTRDPYWLALSGPAYKRLSYSSSATAGKSVKKSYKNS